MAIQVVDEKRGGKGVYIGRTSVLGSPFRLGVDGDRATVVHKYHQWLRQQWQNDEGVRAELTRLAVAHHHKEDVNLVCCCAPLSCHGDVVKLPCHGDVVKHAVTEIAARMYSDEK